MRPVFQWQTGSRSLQLGKRTLLMGILNVTPDSFFDGGRFFDSERAVNHGLQLLDEGADIVDVGGESTRPGASVAAAGQDRPVQRRPHVSAEEERERVIPVIEGLKRLRPAAVLSVDTYKAVVARAALEAGAEIVNDVSALRWDPEMAQTLAAAKCGVVLMHMRGRPEEWRTLPPEADIVARVANDLRNWSEAAMAAGVARERIVLDPGFGFGKNFEENYPLLADFRTLHELGYPLVAGTSRKSFVGRALAGDGKLAPAEARLFGSLAAMMITIIEGAHIVRVHDVKESREAALVADAVFHAR